MIKESMEVESVIVVFTLTFMIGVWIGLALKAL